MSFSKKVRQLVYDKCDGHCAYCGIPITIKEMQIDHVVPVYRGYPDERLKRWWPDIERGTDELDNLMPSCRQCNFYKGMYDLEDFRNNMITLMERVRKPFIFRLAEKYGMVQEKEWDGKFYFERIKENDDDTQ